MDAAGIYLVLAILVLLAVVATVVLAVRSGQARQRLTPLGGLALVFVVAGIVFGESRLIGYGLFAVGIGLAVIDIVRHSRHSRRT